jgi:hypothetical protein
MLKSNKVGEWTLFKKEFIKIKIDKFDHIGKK